jgi:FSR family fosmidomycin resistance protein-like MFS transporter
VSGLGTTVLQPVFGLLSDRWEPRFIIPASVAWMGILLGSMGFMPTYGLLLLVVGVGALGSAAFHPAGASLASEGAGERRGSAISIFSVSGNLGSALSPVVVGFAVGWLGTRGTGVIIPVMLGMAVYLAMRFRQAGHGEADSRRTEQETQRTVNGSKLALGLIVLAASSRSWLLGSVVTYLPEWLGGLGYSLQAAGAALSVLLVSLSLGSLTGGPLSDRAGRIPVLLVSLAGLGPATWLFLHAAGAGQVASAGLIGLMVGASFPVTILMAQEAWPQGPGLASALAIGVGWLPAGIGSWAVGMLADATTLGNALGGLVYVPAVGVAAAVALGLQRKK